MVVVVVVVIVAAFSFVRVATLSSSMKSSSGSLRRSCSTWNSSFKVLAWRGSKGEKETGTEQEGGNLVPNDTWHQDSNEHFICLCVLSAALTTCLYVDVSLSACLPVSGLNKDNERLTRELRDADVALKGKENRMFQENQALKRKIETLESELDRLRKENVMRMDSSSSSSSCCSYFCYAVCLTTRFSFLL